MKKAISLSLSFILIICSAFAVDLSAYAYDTKDSGFKTLYVNPVLEDEKEKLFNELRKTDFESSLSEKQDAQEYGLFRFASSYPTAQQAAITLRDAMVNRKNAVNIKFLSGTLSTEAAVLDVFDRALDPKNASSAVHGDYLHWHLSAVGYRASWSIVNNKYLYTVTYSLSYLTTTAQEEKVTSKIKDVNKKLNLSGKSDYVKALEIHDTVCSFIKYDYDYVKAYETGNAQPLKHSAYGGLFSGLAVCQSYATLFYRLCYENGISSRIVTSTDHAWNIVNIYGKNYFVDCTWDDGLYDDPYEPSGNYWANVYGYDYFLYGTKDVNDYGHILESAYTSPEFKKAYPLEEYGLGGKNCPHESLMDSIPSDASCTAGFTGKTYCRVCLYYFGEYTIPENSRHTYTQAVVKPTCTKQGYTTHACTACTYNYKDAYTAAKGHSYQNRITAASVGKNGKITPTCSVCKATKSSTAIYAPKTLTLSTTNYTYNGKVKKPSVTVKDSKGKALKNGTDYTVSYANGRKNVGKYAVKITFKGKYSGTKTLYFTIKPKNTSITKLTAGKKKFTAKIKKYTTQTTGYQIQYSTSSKFTSAKTINTKNTTTAKTISSLKSGKKYYVRIRTYKTVNGTKYCSAWSSAKTVKVK